MKLKYIALSFCILCGALLKKTDSAAFRFPGTDKYIQTKLQHIIQWLDKRNESTIFDYISQVNNGIGLNLFQGDIKGFNPRHRTAVRDQTYLWNTRVVPYLFDPTFENDARSDVLQAIAEYHAKTCIRFVPRRDQYDYLIFKHISGCYSNIGRQGGPQDVSLMRPCLRKGTAIHEIMHALGFWHEQSRPDRDQWVQVILENIQKGKEFNFDKLSVDEVDTLGVQYDYGSIMHYSKYSFTKNGNPTLLPIRNPNADIGQRNGLSPLDVKRINTLYRCDIPIPNSVLPQTTVKQETPPPPTTPSTTPTTRTTTTTTMIPTTTTTTPTTATTTPTTTTTTPTTTTTIVSTTTTTTPTTTTTTPIMTTPKPTTKTPSTTTTMKTSSTAIPLTKRPSTTPTTTTTKISLTTKSTTLSTQPVTISTQTPTKQPSTMAPSTQTAMKSTTTVSSMRPSTPTTTHTTKLPTTKSSSPSIVQTTKQPTEKQTPTTESTTTSSSPALSRTHTPATVPPFGWSTWSSYTPCDLQCRRSRYRFCMTYDYKYCQGPSSQVETCGYPCKPASYLGCWEINLANISIPSVEGIYPELTDNYQARTAAVRKCADVAAINGYLVFALFDYGMCLTGPSAQSQFSKYGPSGDCGYRGKGGVSGISVYSFQKDIDGQFGMWTDWGQCTRTCDGGVQYRYRRCNNPPPIGNGAQCKGYGRESRPCNTEICNTDTKCGVKYYTGKPGTSGFINLQNYNNYMTCDHKIDSGEANTTISLAFSRIDIEYSRGCLYDILSVYDGPNKFSRPVGDFCGNQRPIPFESSSSAIYIYFESDATGVAGGYTIEYTINSRTRKSCTQLRQPGHAVMIGTSNFVGDTVRFICDPDYRMIGSSIISCVDQTGFALWSDRTPFCVRKFKRSIDILQDFCDFNQNICGYENVEYDDADWMVERRPGKDDDIDNYLKSTPAKNLLPGDVSEIQSKIHTGQGNFCVRFLYKLEGNDNTSLKLYILDFITQERTLIWSKVSSDSEQWELQETNTSFIGQFQMKFEYTTGDTIHSSASLDNITVKTGPC